MANAAISQVAVEWSEELVQELTSCEFELRGTPREKLTAEVVVRPVNRACTIFGEPFHAVTTDISRDGLGFLYSRAVTDRYVCVTFRDQSATSAILRVIRCRPIGSFYEIGGEFVRRAELVGGNRRDLSPPESPHTKSG